MKDGKGKGGKRGEGGEGEREKEERRDLPIFSSRLMGRLRCLRGAALACNTLRMVSNSDTQNPFKMSESMGAIHEIH